MHQDLTRQGFNLFFEQFAHGHVADVLHVTELDHLVGQQAQRPAGEAVRRITAGQHGQLGFHLAGELGRRARPAIVVQGDRYATGEKAPTNVPHRFETAQHSIGNDLVRALLALTAVAQKQDTRSGLGAGRGIASMDDLFQFLALIFGQLDRLMFAHAG